MKSHDVLQIFLYTRDFFSALIHMRRKGCIHRDIKVRCFLVVLNIRLKLFLSIFFNVTLQEASNVMLQVNGKPKICDFNCSKSFRLHENIPADDSYKVSVTESGFSTLTRYLTRTLVGTPHIMAPELVASCLAEGEGYSYEVRLPW